MSEAANEPHDARWATAVAATRGVLLAPGEAQAAASSVQATLRAFAGVVDELAADDDPYEFRRLLGALVPRDG